MELWIPLNFVNLELCGYMCVYVGLHVSVCVSMFLSVCEHVHV